jgi:hypothetical protein
MEKVTVELDNGLLRVKDRSKPTRRLTTVDIRRAD